MRCDCAEQQRRVFPAEIKFKVYLDADPEHRIPPLQWEQNELVVCIGCGEISGLVEGRILMELRAGAGESVA